MLERSVRRSCNKQSSTEQPGFFIAIAGPSVFFFKYPLKNSCVHFVIVKNYVVGNLIYSTTFAAVVPGEGAQRFSVKEEFVLGLLLLREHIFQKVFYLPLPLLGYVHSLLLLPIFFLISNVLINLDYLLYFKFP